MVSYRRKRQITVCFLLVCCVGLWAAVCGEVRPHRLDLESGASARLYWPQNYQLPSGERAAVIALHGMKQTPEETLLAWKTVAESLQILVVSPSGNTYEQGYTREPVDDRARIREIRNHLVSTYGIAEDKIYLAGFSRGGNYAIEMGLYYPKEFSRVICFYGFDNDANQPRLALGLSEGHYANSHFYLVTGYKDLTEPSLTKLYQTLSSGNIPSKLQVFPDLFHAYPRNFPVFFQKVLSEWKDV